MAAKCECSNTRGQGQSGELYQTEAELLARARGLLREALRRRQ